MAKAKKAKTKEGKWYLEYMMFNRVTGFHHREMEQLRVVAEEDIVKKARALWRRIRADGVLRWDASSAVQRACSRGSFVKEPCLCYRIELGS